MSPRALPLLGQSTGRSFLGVTLLIVFHLKSKFTGGMVHRILQASPGVIPEDLSTTGYDPTNSFYERKENVSFNAMVFNMFTDI